MRLSRRRLNGVWQTKLAVGVNIERMLGFDAKSRVWKYSTSGMLRWRRYDS